jgi:hypothetical protein
MRTSGKIDENEIDRPPGRARAPLHSLLCSVQGRAMTRRRAANDVTKEINK